VVLFGRLLRLSLDVFFLFVIWLVLFALFASASSHALEPQIF